MSHYVLFHVGACRGQDDPNPGCLSGTQRWQASAHYWRSIQSPGITFKVLLLCQSKCGIVLSFLILNGFSASPGDGAGDSKGQRPRRLQRKKRIQLPNGRRHGCKFVCRSKTGSDCRRCLKTFFLTKSQTEEAINVFFVLCLCHVRSQYHDTRWVWSLDAMERWSRKFRMMPESGYSSNKVGRSDDGVMASFIRLSHLLTFCFPLFWSHLAATTGFNSARFYMI